MDTLTNTGLAPLSQHWVTVVDEQGRERLEARWFSPQLAHSTAYAA